MNIRDIRALKHTAGEQLDHSRIFDRVLLIFLGLSAGLALAVTLINYVLDLQIANFGGLSNLGIKSFLSTIQMVLPMVETMAVLCLELGYRSAALRVSRGQGTSPNALRLGFDRFWMLLRCLLIQVGIYTGLVILCCYAASLLFVFSPFSAGFLSLLNSGAVELPIQPDSAVFGQVVSAMIPMLIVYAVLLIAVLVPVTYSLRMTDYVIIDRPGLGSFAVLRESRAMMKGNRMALLKLDLSFWWFYLLQAAISLLAYGEEILPLFGITLPLSADAQYFLFYILFLGAQFAVYRLFLNRVETTYALAYEAVCPKKQDEGMVLGNIFRM